MIRNYFTALILGSLILCCTSRSIANTELNPSTNIKEQENANEDVPDYAGDWEAFRYEVMHNTKSFDWDNFIQIDNKSEEEMAFIIATLNDESMVQILTNTDYDALETTKFKNGQEVKQLCNAAADAEGNIYGLCHYFSETPDGLKYVGYENI